MIIENGSDLLLVLNLTDEKGNRIRVNTKNSFTIRVFTVERSNYLEYNKTDIVSTSDNDKLYLNSNELETLESGVIAYTYMYGVGDKNFNDGEYNNQKTVYTDYYYRNSGSSIGAPSNPVDYKVIQQLKDRIKDETDRATAVEGSLFNKMDEHQTEVTSRINQEAENTTSKVNTEASERQAADTALQGKITSLTNTVSSNKTATDKAVSDEVTRAKAAEAKALQDAKNDAAAKYQVKGNYLTSHQDISGKLDKTVASQTYLSKTDATAKYQPKGSYLTSHQDISGKVDKVAGKGLSTNDYTTAEKNKLASLPDDFEGACTDAEIEAMLKELGL